MTLDELAHTIERSHVLNLGLWMASFVGFGVCVGWVMWGGAEAGALRRAEAMEKLWPMAIAWMATLATKSKITGDQKEAAMTAAATAARGEAPDA